MKIFYHFSYEQLFMLGLFQTSCPAKILELRPWWIRVPWRPWSIAWKSLIPPSRREPNKNCAKSWGQKMVAGNHMKPNRWSLFLKFSGILQVFCGWWIRKEIQVLVFLFAISISFFRDARVKKGQHTVWSPTRKNHWPKEAAAWALGYIARQGWLELPWNQWQPTWGWVFSTP